MITKKDIEIRTDHKAHDVSTMRARVQVCAEVDFDNRSGVPLDVVRERVEQEILHRIYGDVQAQARCAFAAIKYHWVCMSQAEEHEQQKALAALSAIMHASK